MDQVVRVANKGDDRQPSIYRVGEIVDVAIRGARVVDLLDTGYVLADDAGTKWVLSYRLTNAQIERVAPAEWPPCTGDLWRDRNGDLWMGQAGDRGHVMVPADKTVTSWWPERLLRELGPLTIVHREPQPPYCEDCEQDGHTTDDCPCRAAAALDVSEGGGDSE